MLKIPRFMKEYANYQRKRIQDLNATSLQLNNAILRIDRVLLNYGRGMITVNEAMRMLSEVL